jgi:SAM-dependent methyltransferase
MDADCLDLPDGVFDFVLCGFAIHLFPNLEQTLREVRRVLRPGGTWGAALTSSAEDPRWTWYDEMVARCVALAQTPAAGRRLALRTPGRVSEVFSRAGFVASRERLESREFEWADEHEWWDSLWTHGTRRPLEAMSPETLDRFRQDALDRVRAMMRAGPLTRRHEFIFTLALKPE